MTEPPILLADEPTGNLDTRTSVEVMEIFQRLRKERGITVILITHDHDRSPSTASRIVSFRDGHIVVGLDEPELAGGQRRRLADMPLVTA